MKLINLYLSIAMVLLFLPIHMQAQSGEILEIKAREALDRVRSADRYHQARAFVEVAVLFEKASAAYDSAGLEEKSGFMSEISASARLRAKEIRQSIKLESFITIESLTGSEFKTPGKSQQSASRDKKRTSFRISLQAGFSNPDKPGPGIYGNGTTEIILEAVFIDPMIFMSLTEQFAGEFLFGDLSGPLEPGKVSLSGNRQFGIGADFSVIPGLFIGVEYTRKEHDLSAELSILVIPWLGDDPYQTAGILNSTVRFQSAGIKMNYVFFKSLISPYAGASIQQSWQQQGLTTVKISEVSFPVDYPSGTLAFASWSAQAGLIIRVNNWISAGLVIKKTMPLTSSDRQMLSSAFGGAEILLTL